MPRKLIVLLAIAATALVAVIAGTLAWDASRDDSSPRASGSVRSTSVQ
jgi:hypothetical protein